MNIIDLHQDLMLYVTRPNLYPNDKSQQTSFEQLKKNNIKVVLASTFVVPDDENYFDPLINEMIERDIIAYTNYCESDSEFTIIKSNVDLDRAIATEDLYGIIIHIEGLNVFNPEIDWVMIERWYEMGLRSIGPVWNHTNPFGGGTFEEGGLTQLGRQLIAWCEQRGVIIDLAHMNQKTFWDTVQVVTKPLFVSHGNSYTVCPNVRNYTDEQLNKVAETGGCIGMFFSKKFLGATEHGIVESHIQRILDIGGPELLAIGSDYGGIVSGFADGFDNVNSLPLLIQSLDESIREKVAYQNALRVISKHLQ